MKALLVWALALALGGLLVTGCDSSGGGDSCASSNTCPLTANASGGTPVSASVAAPTPINSIQLTIANGGSNVSTKNVVIEAALAGGADASTLISNSTTPDSEGNQKAGDETMDTVQLEDQNGNLIPINLTPTSTGFAIQPSCNLSPNTQYTVLILPGLENSSDTAKVQQQLTAGTFTTNGTYSGSSCDDPVVSWNPPTTGPVPTSYQIYWATGSAPTIPSDPSLLDPNSGIGTAAVTGQFQKDPTGKRTYQFVVHQQFEREVPYVFVMQSCVDPSTVPNGPPCSAPSDPTPGTVIGPQ